METLNEAINATQEVRSLDAFQWIEDKADKLDDGLHQFEGSIPSRMQREIEAKMVEVGFDREMAGKATDSYFVYMMPTDGGEIKVRCYEDRIWVRIKTSDYTPYWEEEDEEEEEDVGRFRSA